MLRVFPVGVVLHRSASVESAVVQSVGHLHHHAEAEQVGHVVAAVGSEFLCHFHCAVAPDEIRQGEVRFHLGQGIYGSDLCGLCTFVGHCTESFQLQGGILPCLVHALHTGTHVVVGHGAPEIGFQRTALAQQGSASCFVAGEQAGLLVESHHIVGSGDGERVLFLIVFHLLVERLGITHTHGTLEIVACHGQLLVGHRLSGHHEGFRLLEAELHVEHQFGTLSGILRRIVVQFVFAALLWTYLQVVYHTLFHLLAVFQEFPKELVVVDVAEEMLIEHAHFAGHEIYGFHPHILIVVAHFVELRIGHTVRAHQSVAVEVVVACVVVVVVAAVGDDFRALGIASVQALVHEVPDKAALVFGCGAHGFPVFFEATARVAHGMAVLTLYEGFGGSGVGTIFGTIFLRGIHGAIDVGVVAQAGALILHGAALVLPFYPSVGLGEVGSVDGFIAHRPCDDAGMVEVYRYVVLVALHDLFGKLRFLGLRSVIIAESVALLVGLGAQVDAVFVAQVVPHGVVGIVAGSHGVDVEPLHNLQILYHPLPAHHIASVGIHLMPVGTLYIDGLTVHEQLSVAYLHAAESHPLPHHLDGGIRCLVVDFCHKGVQIGSLGSPFLYERHLYLAFGPSVGLRRRHDRGVGHHLPIVGEQLIGYLGGTCALGAYHEQTVGIVIVKVAVQSYVVEVASHVTAVEVAVACHAGEAPEVLVLAVGAVAPPEGLEGDEVVAGMHKGCDVKLGSHLRILGVAHVFAIDPYREVARSRTHVEIDLLTLPVGRQIKGTAIGTGIVVGLTDIRGIALEGGTPGISHVLIGLVAIAIQLEESGHGEVHPLGIVVLQREEVLRRILMVLHEMELPHTLHREETGRLGFVALRLLRTLEGEEVGTARLTVLLVHVWVHPLWCLLGIG